MKNRPIMILETKVFYDFKSISEMDNLCKDNMKNLLLELAAKDEVINQLEKRVHRNELELAYNRGDLTEEEYQNELSKLI